MRFILALIIAAPLLTAGSAWADWRDGAAAHERGDYETAMREWEPLAENGDLHAIWGLAQMYYMGRGVPRNLGIYAKWMKVAAMQGDSRAAFGLGSMYEVGNEKEEDIPFPRNYQTAIEWYELAMTLLSSGTPLVYEEIMPRPNAVDLVERIETLQQKISTNGRIFGKRIFCKDSLGGVTSIFDMGNGCSPETEITRAEYDRILKSYSLKRKIIYCRKVNGEIYQLNSIKVEICSSRSDTQITKAEYDRQKSKAVTDTVEVERQEASSETTLPTEIQSTKAKLRLLKKMLDEGLITEEEAAAKRAKLLEDL